MGLFGRKSASLTYEISRVPLKNRQSVSSAIHFLAKEMSCLLQIEILSGNHIPKLSLERVQNVFVAKKILN